MKVFTIIFLKNSMATSPLLSKVDHLSSHIDDLITCGHPQTDLLRKIGLAVENARNHPCDSSKLEGMIRSAESSKEVVQVDELLRSFKEDSVTKVEPEYLSGNRSDSVMVTVHGQFKDFAGATLTVDQLTVRAKESPAGVLKFDVPLYHVPMQEHENSYVKAVLEIVRKSGFFSKKSPLKFDIWLGAFPLIAPVANVIFKNLQKGSREKQVPLRWNQFSEPIKPEEGEQFEQITIKTFEGTQITFKNISKIQLIELKYQNGGVISIPPLHAEISKV